MDCIRTERLLLRRATPADATDLHAVFRDPAAMRYWSTLPHTTLAQTEAWLSGMVAGGPDSDDYVIERAGRVIGKAGCWRMPEIGFILHPSAWRQGLASEALGALIPRLFERHPIEAITADVDPRNAASLALLARHGFQETGSARRTFKLGEEWCDSLYLARRR